MQLQAILMAIDEELMELDFTRLIHYLQDQKK